MKDKKLVEMLFSRQETAVTEVENEYGNYLRSISMRILRNSEDSEECVNDTLLKMWESIPPKNPQSLKAYLGAVVRNCSLDCYRKKHREKRNIDMADVFEECQEIGCDNLEKTVELAEISKNISLFLHTKSEEKRFLFIGRYYYGFSTKELASITHATDGKVKMTLSRMRKELKKLLEKEGIYP